MKAKVSNDSKRDKLNKTFNRKWFVVAASLLIVVASYIPIKGNSFASVVVKEWSDNIIFTHTIKDNNNDKDNTFPELDAKSENHTVESGDYNVKRDDGIIKIITERNELIASVLENSNSDDSYKKVDEIFEEYDEKIWAYEDIYYNWDRVRKSYDSSEDARENCDIDLKLPEYIPNGFEFSKIEYSELELHTMNQKQVQFRVKYVDNENSHRIYNRRSTLGIQYNYYIDDNDEVVQRNVGKEIFPSGSEFVKLEVNDADAYILKQPLKGESSEYYSLCAVVHPYSYDYSLTVRTIVKTEEVEEKREEIIRIVESLLKDK